jgi:hypothetical protein
VLIVDSLFGHLPNDRDTITYTVGNLFGCAGSVSLVLNLSVCDGIIALKPGNAISIYPNPASTELYIVTENFHATEMTMYDVNGQLVRSGKFGPKIDISTLSSGAYLIEVKAGELTARKMFVKM